MKKIFIVLIIILISGNVFANLTATEGLAIDLSSAGAGTDMTIAFDPTELLGSYTWGDGSTDTIVWTWNRATGTDLTMTFGDDLFTLGNSLTIVTGKNFILGTTQWNSADEMDGTKIKDADYGDIDVSAGGVWTLDTDVVDVDALDQTISPTLTGRWTFAGEDTGTDVIGLNVNWAGSDPTNGQSEGDLWYDSTLNVYKGYTTHEIILGSAEEPGIIQAKKGSAGTISAGDAVYISGFDGTDLLIEFADADDSSKMPAIGIAAATINSGTAGSVTTFGLLEDIINTGGMSVGDGIWITVTGTTGNTLTNTKPTGATTAIQRIATVASSAASGELFVAGALRTNDESNLTEAYIFVGNSSQNSTAVAMSGDVAIIANGETAIQTNAVALTTDTTGNYSNGNAEAGDALVSIAVEITDNENTAENNPIVFVAGAAQTGGDLGLETDGDLYYNPSTGTVTTTVFVENGNAVISEAVATAGLIFGDSTPDADGEIAFDTTGDGSTVTAGVLDIYDGTEVVHYFGSAGYPTGDNQILKYDAGTNKVIWEVDAGAAGGDAWSDAVDSDILPTGNDNIYDLGSVAASFKDGYFQGTLEAGTLTEGGNAVPNATDHLGFFGGTTSAQLLAELSDETGTGLLVFNDAPTFEAYVNIDYSNDSPANSPFIKFLRDRDGDPTRNVANNDRIGNITFNAYHTDGYYVGAAIRANVDGSPGSADMPGRLEFLTTADGAQVTTLRMTIDSEGNTEIGFDAAAYLRISTADGGITTISQISDGTDEIKFGDGGDLISVDSGNWDVSNAGAFTGVTGITSTGNIDFGDADLEIPQASPAVPDTDGEIEFDFTDGSLVIQHGSAHAEIGSPTDVVIGKLIRCWGGTIFEPDGVNDVMTVKAINSIEFPHGVVITAIYLGVSENTTYTLTVQNFDDFDTINGGAPTIDAVTYTANATGEVIDTSPTYDTIAAGQLIMISIPATDVAWIHFEIYYYEPAA